MIKRNIKYYKIILILVFIQLLGGCIDKFMPVLDKTESKYILVVEGLITNKPGSFEIKLGRSVPIDTTLNLIEESGAHVSITDDAGNIFELYEMEPGLYKCLQEDAVAVPGRSYQLNIIDSGNNEYESTPVVMEETPEISSVEWSETEEQVFIDNEVINQPGIDISVNTNDPENQVRFFKWDIVETWQVFMPDKITALDGKGMPYEAFVKVPDEKKHCWVTMKSDKILIQSVENTTESSVNNFHLQRIRPDEDKLFIRYSAEVQQYAINNEMYEFWEALKEINQESGSMYDRVPTSVFGNISCCNTNNKVLGYFHAAEVKTKRIFIERGEHNVPSINNFENCLYVSDITTYPFVERFYARSEFCSDCRFYGSSQKPEFW